MFDTIINFTPRKFYVELIVYEQTIVVPSL